ncbi:Sodium- and chloride-dependent transporter XTRP3 [Portunus trituberculatus]|uniref:Sodium-and chloride-dependent transporter XTRP3 n=1 Tax=Portunus trituberculatus TaxID=210409 RepID=A0A5B7K2F4_PORTR|nr:Sodium- and chloride-dependent transporter XTRP3 [Portunus trituberculatus]
MQTLGENKNILLSNLRPSSFSFSSFSSSSFSSSSSSNLFPTRHSLYVLTSLPCRPVALACTVCCTISMAFAHGAGNYVFILFDDFSGNIPLLIVAFFECVSVSYVYGLRR